MVDLARGRSDVGVEGRRIGGCFWVLADDEDEDEGGEVCAVVAPSAPLQRALVVVPKQKSVAGVQTTRSPVKMKAAATTPRLWVGPLPKVSLTDLKLSDFVEFFDWKVVRNKKQRQGPVPAVPAPKTKPMVEIRGFRADRLNMIIEPIGPVQDAPIVVRKGLCCRCHMLRRCLM
ncbi:hypothetical protein ZWY2020_000708 [Hordeum vulgare]|nr:hypothetical protein ZWY2020_000708 [Hordeum vulgare]